MTDPSDTPGTIEWWTQPALWVRGPVDAILRLLEQEEITRGKARELLAYVFAGCPHRDQPPPPAPWDNLNWCDDEAPPCPWCRGTGSDEYGAQCSSCDGAKTKVAAVGPHDPYSECSLCGRWHYTHADVDHAFSPKQRRP